MPNLTAKNIATFIPAGEKDEEYDTAIRFYNEIGFETIFHSERLSLLGKDDRKFFVQKYSKEWIYNNMMMVLEVENLDDWWTFLSSLDLEKKYEGVKIKAPEMYPWGIREVHLIDTCGVLWHIS